MPGDDLRVRGGQLVVAGVKKIPEHPEQIEIHKTRLRAEQKRLVREHFLKGNQFLFQLFEPLALLRAPLVKAAAAKLALLEPQETELVRPPARFPSSKCRSAGTPRPRCHFQ